MPHFAAPSWLARSVLLVGLLGLAPLVSAGCGGEGSPAEQVSPGGVGGGASGQGGGGGAGAAGGTLQGGASGGGEAGAAGASEGGAGGQAGAPVEAGADAVVTPFDKAHVYFTGSDNKRVIDAEATFPAEGAYSKITLTLTLACPQGGCDPWDRFASLGIVQKGADGAPDTEIEIARYITPFRVGASWTMDVTDLRPLLSGTITLRTFIDTWVGPGSQLGAGWLVTASFEMTGGVPERVPVAVVPVWARQSAVYGDPARPIPGQVKPRDLPLPEGATSYALRTFVTGHGQGNAGNCAEFCSKKHTITVGGVAHEETIWRTDCATTGAPKQQGTWKFSRAGWCPGADVRPWLIDVTADLTASTASFAYDVAAYENTCRPDAMTCKGCSLGTGCAYDDGSHTEPNYQLSSLLIAYR